MPGPPAEKEAPPPMSVLSTHRGTWLGGGLGLRVGLGVGVRVGVGVGVGGGLGVRAGIGVGVGVGSRFGVGSGFVVGFVLTSASSFQPTPSKASAKCEIGSSEASRTSPPVYALAVLCGGAPPAALPKVACARLTWLGLGLGLTLTL